MTRKEIERRLNSGGFCAELRNSCPIYLADDIGGDAIGSIQAGCSVAVLAFEMADEGYSFAPASLPKVVCNTEPARSDLYSRRDFRRGMVVWLLVDPEDLREEQNGAGHDWQQIGSGAGGYVVEACANCSATRSKAPGSAAEYQHRVVFDDGTAGWTSPSTAMPDCEDELEAVVRAATK